MKPMQPTHYTIRDGSYWYNWKGNPVTEDDLDISKTVNRLIDIPYSDDCFYRVHSLAFSNPIDVPTHSFPRWDCINSWTTTFEEIEEINTGV